MIFCTNVIDERYMTEHIEYSQSVFQSKNSKNCKPQIYYIKWCVRVFTLQMEETFVINLADDSESDSSDVDIDIAGCDFYQNSKNYN